MRIVECPVCNGFPVPYRGNVRVRDTTVKLWICECMSDGEENTTSFIEHSISVYGSSQKEVVTRWNEALEVKNG